MQSTPIRSVGQVRATNIANTVKGDTEKEVERYEVENEKYPSFPTVRLLMG